VLRVRAEDGLPYASRVRPMRLFIASVSRNADPVILDAAHFRSLQPGARQSPGDLVAARGIGANIEAVPASMIARKATTEAAVKPPQARDDPLMETCLYALTPSP